MNYDCHLEVCSLTPRENVSAYLRRSKLSGVVYVQKGGDHRSRSEWINHMNGSRGACGVAVVNPYDSQDGFSRLAALGVCGALLTVNGPTSVDRIHEEICSLHEALPRQWHIELETTWANAAALAPLLARTERVFCLNPQLMRGGVKDATLRKLLWWLDMGNAYIKFTGAHIEKCPSPIYNLVWRSTPDRVVLGSGEVMPRDGALWLDEEFICLDQADDNAKRLYPFFRVGQNHCRLDQLSTSESSNSLSVACEIEVS